MNHLCKRVLVIADDPGLRHARHALLASCGYSVVSVTEAASDAELEVGGYQLVVIGRDARSSTTPLDMRLCTKFPALPILKIDLSSSPFASKVVSSDPTAVLKVAEQLLACS